MDLSKPPGSPPATPGVSVVIPVLNEAGTIAATLRSVREELPTAEILVVDGGSTDGTAATVRGWAQDHGGPLHLLQAEAGRARQMNHGAAGAQGEVLLFLHADTLLPGGAEAQLLQALSAARVVGGAFRHGFREDSPGLRMISAWSNVRSRWRRNFYGDQALFVRRRVFQALQGFRDMPLFEDLDLSKRMRRMGATVLLPSAVLTSGRRFRQGGVGRTLWRMLRLKLLYAVGGDLQQPARHYRSDARRGVHAGRD